MGKVFNSMVFGIIISVSLLLLNSTGTRMTNLFSLLLNPTDWTNNGFWLMFAAVAGISGVILIGLAAIIRQDWVWRAGIMVSLSSIVISPYVDLFTFVNSQLTFISSNCVNSPVCTQLNSLGGIGQFIGLGIAGIPLLYALWACVEFVWKGDSF
jgi:predicted membrane metal-binding protein